MVQLKKRHVRVLELALAHEYQNMEWIRGRKLTILCPLFHVPKSIFSPSLTSAVSQEANHC